jgi:hypothetical protein
MFAFLQSSATTTKKRALSLSHLKYTLTLLAKLKLRDDFTIPRNYRCCFHYRPLRLAECRAFASLGKMIFFFASATTFAFAAAGCSGNAAATTPITTSLRSPKLLASFRSHPSPSPSPSSTQTPEATSTPSWHQAQSSDAFVDSIGVDTHFSYPGSVYDSTTTETILEALGVRHIRDGSGGAAHFSHLIPHGIHMNIVWNLEPLPVSSWNPTPSAFATRVGVTNIDSYESTNESNYSCTNNAFWVSQTKAQQVALSAYMQANGLGSIPVLAPSYGACSGIPQMVADASSMGSLAAYSTDGNLHSYPGTNNYPEATCLTAAQAGNCSGSYWEQSSNIENPNQPVVVTETGYESQSGGCQWNAGTLGQERYNLRELLNNWSHGIVRTYIFSFLDDYSDDGCYLGIVNDNYAVKPAYTAIKNLIATLADPGSPFSAGALNYSLGGSLTNINSVLLQKRTGVFELVLWQAVASIDSSGNPRTLTPESILLRFPTAPTSVNAQTFTSTGALSSVKVTSANSAWSLPVSDTPVVVSIQL